MDSDTKLKALKSTRASVKGQMTKLYNYVVAPADKQDIDGFQSKLARAKVLLKQFEEVEASIFELDSDQDSGIIDFTEQYYVVESKLNRYIREYNAQNPDESQMPANNSMNATMTQSVDVRLPKITIEPFSGKYTDWQAFYDLYVKTIHENMSLSPAQKFQYLKGFLRGDAYNLLKHMPISESNYFEAFRKLCIRYDRKKHTIKAFIRSFMDQPTIHQANATNVRKLLDNSDEIVRGLKALGSDAESRDVWLLYILEEKLDAESRALWAQVACEEDLPTLDDFFKFLLNRSDALESLKPVATKRLTNQRSSKVFVTAEIDNCPVCQANHSLIECDKFKRFSVAERRQCIKADNRCFNCLKLNHPVFRCLLKTRCGDCGKKHHTLLHLHEPKEQASTSQAEQNKIVAHARAISANILPTALVTVFDHVGVEHECRVLLDSGSMSTFITERLSNVLKLPKRNHRTIVTGISGSGKQVTKGAVTVVLKSKHSNHEQIKVEALIMTKLCSKLPVQSFYSEFFDHNLLLADPKFNICNEIDIILGVQHVFNILLEGRIKHHNNIVAIETVFGWVLGGEIESSNSTTSNVNQITTEQCRLEDLLKQFWEIEEIPKMKLLTDEEQRCERLFAETTYRSSKGRFVVKLPLKNEDESLGNSINIALSRQRAMERKFHKDANFKKLYVQFMKEYLHLGHMVEVQGSEATNLNYLPHHGIVKSDTSKFRVVFDASAKTSNGSSLNDLLMVGPQVQPTLYAIILRFRLNKIAISADIEKMYRQILVTDEHMEYQGIVWRSNEEQPMQYFKLRTLTYGTSAAPYLATRVLSEIAAKHRDQLPTASKALSICTYVDDLMAGANTIEEAFEVRNGLITMLDNAGMRLRKWISNSDEFLFKTPEDDRADCVKDFTQEGITVKVLGLRWDPNLDMFSYRVNMGSPIFTKRKLLSECSQIFDPLGWLSPVIINIKMLFQTLWLIPVDWDDELPPAVKQKWITIREQLHHLESVRVPRWLGTPSSNIELHGFCDASERAYAAVVYMRHPTISEAYDCCLIAAKSKVAPVKKISVARLELCAAHLLTKLMKSITEILNISISKTICWTDSTIVLDWLSDVPIRWQTFVGNRTSQILEVVKRDSWRHVPTKNNPADCASRGILPSEILNHDLWWGGPKWLRYNSENWPEQQVNYDTQDEERAKFSMTLLAECHKNSILAELINKLSSFRKLIKTTAVIQRFIHNARRKVIKRKGPLTTTELEEAIKLCCKTVQTEYMMDEIIAMKHNKPLKSHLTSLNPFIDGDGVVRVGGRIQNSSLQFDAKHPVIIPSSRFAKLLIEDFHSRYHHAGAQLLLATLRQKYWIIRAKHEIRQVIRKCIPCFKVKPIPLSQEMGILPKCRVQHVRAFLQVGTDFAGPFQVFHKRGRGQKPVKAYVCLFVCTSTRAVHIEVTSDLSSNTFLAALRRFVSRRGLCTDIFSDCGSNYIGADNKLREIFSFLKCNFNEIYNYLSSESINWHFNPPNAPHFGGLWEAAVKSMKYHLKRVIGETILTVEELQTLVTEIEALLNSRPICMLPSDTDLDVLTPSHFIIGHSLISVPEKNLTHEKISRLNRWEMLQKMKQHIWQRWHVEYLTSMQSRTKWTSVKPNIQIDDIVLVIDKNLPPTKWLLGRIVEVFTGKDGLIRVASVKTKNGIFRRAIHALCKVPVESDDSRSGKMLEADDNLK